MSLFSRMVAQSTSVASPDFWLTRSFAPTHAGTFVSEFVALNLPAVYACVGIISDAVAQLPIRMAQEQKSGRVKPVTEHDTLELVASQPNPFMTEFSWQQAVQSHSLLWGNGYSEIQRTEGGAPIALWPLLPDRTVVERDPRRERGPVFARTVVDGKQFTLDHSDYLHVPALGFDGLTGYSPIWMARQAVGLALALEEFGAKFFKHDAKSGGFIHYPGQLSDTAEQNIRESLEKQGGLDDAHRVKILEEGAKFVSTTIPPDDAQFLGTRQFQLGEIARIYRVPLHMIGSQEKSTSWGTGIESMSLGFLKYTLQPWLVRWEHELTRKLLSGPDRDKGLFYRHDAEELLRGDSKARAEFYEKALSPETGWMNRDEVRAREDLPPDEDDRPRLPAAPPREPTEDTL